MFEATQTQNRARQVCEKRSLSAKFQLVPETIC